MPLLLIALLLGSSLDRTTLKVVLKRANPAFKHCYEDALRRDGPDLAGKARLTLTVAASGRVDEVAVEFPMEAPEFTQCLRGAALKLRFLQGHAGFKLIWPILFQGS